jgi:hypothetical protein
VDGLTDLAVELDVLRVHARAVRSLGEREWAQLSARLQALGPEPEAFGEAYALAGVPEEYAAVRDQWAELARTAATTLVATAGTLDRLAARYQEADMDEGRAVGPEAH